MASAVLFFLFVLKYNNLNYDEGNLVSFKTWLPSLKCLLDKSRISYIKHGDTNLKINNNQIAQLLEALAYFYHLLSQSKEEYTSFRCR